MACHPKEALQLLAFLKKRPEVTPSDVTSPDVNAPNVNTMDAIRGLDDIFPAASCQQSTLASLGLEEIAQVACGASAATEVETGHLCENALPAVTARLSIAELLQQDQAQETLSSCDYMMRNNRILSDSIANLAETYFKYAANNEKTA